ncbi:hypothetical protein OHA72_10520 [Dactylosporangium sp. NBC_01737]|uniref:hypothetical protein n=1 Tax=Dactylosporangium sp. NBC_01737 TaxID=2975959 RepID=UPI002E10D873|nr:hypothetical protein OHA72_10520 [Dactylosporangium sp. NBC_01737]
MLSTDTVHALTGWLLTATEAPDIPALPRTRRPGPHPGNHRTRTSHRPVCNLLLLHDGPAFDVGPHSRCMTGAPVAINRHLLDAHRGGLPDLLPDLAAALHPHRPAATAPHGDILHGVSDAVSDLLATAGPGMRLVACAVLYDDIHTGTATCADTPGDGTVEQFTVTAVRRADAVDVDGRAYQAVCLPGASATVIVDDEPDPYDSPATLPGLTALLAAAGRTGPRDVSTMDGGG